MGRTDQQEPPEIGLRADDPDQALVAVDRRRSELLSITFFILLAVTVVTVVLAFADLPQEWLGDFAGTLTTARIALLLIAGAFALYVFEKEKQFRRATNDLVRQRVLAASLDARLHQILAVADASRRVVSALELEDVMELVLEAVFDLMEADEGSVMLVDGDRFVVAAVRGRDPLLVGERVPIGSGVAGHVVRTKRGVLLEKDSHEELSMEFRRPDEIQSAMSVPLLVDGDVVGLVNLNITSGERRYEEQDLRALEIFAGHAAAGVRNARLLRRERLRSEVVTSVADDLESSLDSIVATLMVLKDDEGRKDSRIPKELVTTIETKARELRAATEHVVRDVQLEQKHEEFADAQRTTGGRVP